MGIRYDVIDMLYWSIYDDKAWGAEWAEVCERAGYKCEYCDKDMLASLDNYLSMEKDHIIPKSAQGREIVDNYALSCSTCNGSRLKGTWNPADEAGEGASRDELIQAVRRELKKRRDRKYEEYLDYQEIVGYPSSHQHRGKDSPVSKLS